MNPPNPRYLTKSRFKLANECPTKLFYTGKKQQYLDKSFDDDFLAALAEGGFQVGELAKALYPGGHDIVDLDYETSLARTAALLEQDDVIIYEPAFCFENLFVRVDVLVKQGNRVDLIEVKAKSCDGPGEEQFLNPKVDAVSNKWKPYLEDAVFQRHVLAGAHPEWEISTHLMLVNKRAACPTDGLHQKFLLRKDANGRASCHMTSALTPEELASDLLLAIPLQVSQDLILAGTYGPGGAWTFEDWVSYLAEKYQKDERIWAEPSSQCKGCQFQASAKELGEGMRSGFRECWTHRYHLQAADFAAPLVLEIWNCRTKDKWLGEGRIQMAHLDEGDFSFAKGNDGAMATKERQWIQVKKVQQQDPTTELRSALKKEMDQWNYPLHFIDFETMSPAIPMHAGCRPYEVLAFQFSHHLMQEDGSVVHAGEYIEHKQGAFPNFDFVRALKRELEGDDGTIFRYAPHENTVLCGIREQLLREASSVADSEELIAFIETITRPPGRDAGAWTPGPRDMVDLLEMVKRYYYDPLMGGSNSIKQVLPAVLNTSDYLKEKYRNPIYGNPQGISSLNFSHQAWVQEEDGCVVDPYKLLPTLFEGFSEKDREELLSRDGSIDNGGAAMTAFARMQFTEMGDAERTHLRELLLKYCELDTLAMVMIYEAWREWLGNSS